MCVVRLQNHSLEAVLPLQLTNYQVPPFSLNKLSGNDVVGLNIVCRFNITRALVNTVTHIRVLAPRSYIQYPIKSKILNYSQHQLMSRCTCDDCFVVLERCCNMNIKSNAIQLGTRVFYNRVLCNFYTSLNSNNIIDIALRTAGSVSLAFQHAFIALRTVTSKIRAEIAQSV
jgi:hypothetical protein